MQLPTPKFKDKTLKMPECKPPKNPGRDKSKDNEIKMQMAKDIFCKYMEQDKIPTERLDDIVWFSCSISEQIFNRFNK